MRVSLKDLLEKQHHIFLPKATHSFVRLLSGHTDVFTFKLILLLFLTYLFYLKCSILSVVTLLYFTDGPLLGDLSDDHVLNNLVAATSDLRISDRSATNEPKRGLIFLLPMRLGAGHRIDPNHVQTLLQLIQDPACIGLIGGRPRHSIYAPAVQSDRIFYLDPHFNQPTLNISDLSEDSNFDVSVSSTFSEVL